MKRRNARRCSGLALVGLLALALALEPPAARGQPPLGPRPQPGQAQPQLVVPGGGTELFRAIFDAAKVRPVQGYELQLLLKDLAFEPGPAFKPGHDLIVVVLGAPHQWQANDPLWWARQVVRNGGAALIASDDRCELYTAGNRNAARQIGNFNGDTVRANDQNPNDTHRGNDECPYAVPVAPDERPGADPNGRVWGVFRGLTRVATNQPTYINITQYQNEYQHPLARLPRSSFSPTGFGFRTPPTFAVGGDGAPDGGKPGYSFLAVADSSVFINQMLLEPGTDNRKLAFRTVEYLRGPDGERTRCVFFENGRLVERFDGLQSAFSPPLPPVPPDAMPNLGTLFGKNQDKLIDFLDAKADELQDRDTLHKAMVGPPGSEREERSAARWVERTLAIAAVAVVLFLLRKLWGGRHPQDAPPPPNAGAGAASTGPPGVFDRRQKELARRNNLYEPVRAVVREFFASAGAPAAPGPRMPALEISRAVRKPESLRLALRDLWRLAYGPPAPLTAQRWYELEPYFERLKRAHADGKWKFEPAA
ncbi:hypothetical protein R5W24_005007 [Gemmata sp. JC717]|uniref:hypothetical protein n=1 Tax=Gemmata algarum TaxID=2975278 RepID=UPI0021BB8F02|nr:hypothetical protein [Gemmata algarum]MDY3555861.1 hypothetical protein [Gemmata algarum]